MYLLLLTNVLFLYTHQGRIFAILPIDKKVKKKVKHFIK